jgi:hypothetical protein
MFDYQAGEKYKLTLIMVGIAGLMAGMFFSFLLMPQPDMVSMNNARRRGPMKPHMTNPDVTGIARIPGMQGDPAMAAQQAQASQGPPPIFVDPFQAKLMIEKWLPMAWDLSAGTARQSQDSAMTAMTPECQQGYRQSVWTPDIQKQIDECGLQSAFAPSMVNAGGTQADGTVVVTVQGTQKLGVPGKGEKIRQVKMEYLIKGTPDGMRIAGISDISGSSAGM